MAQETTPKTAELEAAPPAEAPATEAEARDGATSTEGPLPGPRRKAPGPRSAAGSAQGSTSRDGPKAGDEEG
jgi:hypothetical protein